MYAERFADGPRVRPGSLGVALAINGGVVAALLLASPVIDPPRERPPLVIETIPVDPVTPDPVPPRPETPRTAQRQERPDTTQPLPFPLPDPGQTVRDDPMPTEYKADPGPLAGPGVEPPVLPFVAASVDPRYAGDFQPDYPDTARDAGREGVVRIRVLIGIDGRVVKVERIAGEDVFWRAASRHALARWRFTPATRGAVPEESWRVMTVRFRLD